MISALNVDTLHIDNVICYAYAFEPIKVKRI